MKRTVKTMEAEIAALKAEYEGVATKQQFEDFRQDFDNHIKNEAYFTKLTKDETDGVRAWGRLSVDFFSSTMNKIIEKDFVGFVSIVSTAAEYAHVAYRGTYGRNEDWTKRRQRAANRILYMSDESFAEVETIIAGEKAKEDARNEAMKEKAEA